MTVEIYDYGFLSTDYETPDNYLGDDVIAINKQSDGTLAILLRSTYTQRNGERVTKHFTEYIPAGAWERVRAEL